MVFSSITFLYIFLPILILIYFAVPSKLKNLVLLVFSLIFYIYGEPKLVTILILSGIINYVIGRKIGKEIDKKERKKAKVYLILGIVYNLGQLIYFKYTNFFIENINNILNLDIKLINVILPIGISFYTFQAISYVVDVYRKDIEAEKSIFTFITYLTLFPQLIAGPIVRYKDVAKDIHERKTNLELFGKGAKRLIIGLGKKVLIANVLGQMVFELETIKNVSVTSNILEAVGYTLQIYFDFSGYSDMAIGLGLMFGFRFLENFNYPLIATSITDFWRRWHISLSSFFRDYIYIPLGGNRTTKLKWIRNILFVWLLTGFWHGAQYNFILWGVYFGIILIIEKNFLTKHLEKHKIIGRIYSIILIVISFVIFKSNNMQEVKSTISGMLGFSGIDILNVQTMYLVQNYLVILIIAIIAATPISKIIERKENSEEKIMGNKKKIILSIIEIVFYTSIFIAVTAYLIDQSFNPFLYFRF